MGGGGDEIRKDFEEWFKGKYLSLNYDPEHVDGLFVRTETEEYYYTFVDNTWAGWKAAQQKYGG